MSIEAVELDPAVVDVATNWFDLQPDEKLVVHVADGIEFVRSLVASGMTVSEKNRFIDQSQCFICFEIEKRLGPFFIDFVYVRDCAP